MPDCDDGAVRRLVVKLWPSDYGLKCYCGCGRVADYWGKEFPRSMVRPVSSSCRLVRKGWTDQKRRHEEWLKQNG